MPPLRKKPSAHSDLRGRKPRAQAKAKAKAILVFHYALCVRACPQLRLSAYVCVCVCVCVRAQLHVLSYALCSCLSSVALKCPQIAPQPSLGLVVLV